MNIAIKTASALMCVMLASIALKADAHEVSHAVVVKSVSVNLLK